MAEGYLTEEIVQLLREKYLFNNKHENFLDKDVSLIDIYLRLLTVYDEVNQLEEENAQVSSNLRHILRCLRPLGLSYLVQNSKELLDKKKATRIIYALHDKISSKYGKTVSQRVRQVIMKEKMSKTSSSLRKLINQKDLVNSSDSAVKEKMEFSNLPFERNIPKGRQIPRTPLKTEENNASTVEKKQKETVPIPPPPMFEDSPKKEENGINLQNSSIFVLTPPSEFCDSSSTSDDNTQTLESDSTDSPASNYEEESVMLVPSEKPSTMFNKRLTYCIGKETDDSGVSYSSSETSLIEENDPLVDGNAKSNIKLINKCATKGEEGEILFDKESFIHNDAKGNRLPIVNKRRTYCIPKVPSITEKTEENLSENSEEEDSSDVKNKRRTYIVQPNSRPFSPEHHYIDDMREHCGEESTSDIKNTQGTFAIRQDPGKSNIAKKESNFNETYHELNKTVNKRRTYCVPKVPSITEKSEENLSENSEEEDSSDVKNKRRTYIVQPNSRPCRSDHHSDDNMREHCSEESTSDVIRQDPGKSNIATKESNFNETNHELNKTVDDLDATINKALFIDIIKNDISFIDRGVFPRGRELSRTPPSLNSSYDPCRHMGNIGTPTSVANVNKFITIPESKAVSTVYSAETHELEKCIEDTTFTVKSEESAFVFDDSFALFPCKKERNDKVANDNHLNGGKSTVNKDKEPGEDVRHKVGKNTSKSKVAHVGLLISDENEDFNLLTSEMTKEAKITRKQVSKTLDAHLDTEQTETKGVEKEIINKNEKHEQKMASNDNENFENIGNEVSPVKQIRDKSKGTRTARKAGKENIKFINEEEINKRQLKTLDSDNCKPKVSPKKSQGEETKPMLKTDNEDEETVTKKKRRPKSKINDNDKNFKEFETNLNVTYDVKGQVQNENVQVLEEKESELNETFLKPNADITKQITERKRRLKKTISSNGDPETEPENLISVRPVRSKKRVNYGEEAKNVVKQNVITSNHTEEGNEHNVQSATHTAETKSGPKTKTAKNRTKIAFSSQEKELEESKILENDIPFNKPSDIEKTIQDKRSVRRNLSSRVALMVEKFNKVEESSKEINTRTRTKPKKNSKLETDKEILESNEISVKGEKDTKSNRKINTRKITENEDNKENDVKDRVINEKKEEIKSKAKGRQKNKSEDEDKENQENGHVDFENVKVIKSKGKANQKKNKVETENAKAEPKSAPKIAKKPLLENVNENKCNVENKIEESRRPSRKCKSYAKLAISNMLGSPSEQV